MINTLETVKEFKDDIQYMLSIEEISEEYALKLMCNYIDLLEQPLKLWMFVPCDENDKPLEGKELYYIKGIRPECEKHNDRLRQAEERVLFKNANYSKENGSLIVDGSLKVLQFETISELAQLDIEIKLTDNFKKLITG